MHADDAEMVVKIWNEKWEPWHERLRSIEAIKPIIEENTRMTKAIHDCLCGPIGKPEEGLAGRIHILESWKISTTSRVKNQKALWYSIVGGAVTAGVVGFAKKVNSIINFIFN